VRVSAYIFALALTAAGSGVAAPQQSASNTQLASLKGVVTNSVTEAPLRKAFVRLYPGSGNALPATTDEQGRFVFENLKPGSYKLEGEHVGFIESLLADATGTPVVLRLAAGETADANLKLTPQAAIGGRVLDSDGDVWVHGEAEVYRSVFIRGKRQLEHAGSSELDDQGRFRIAELAAGTYYIKARPSAQWERANRSGSEGHLQPAWYPDSYDAEGSTSVTLSPGQELSGIEIRLRRSATYRIRGTVSGLESVPKPASMQAGRRIWASSALGPGGNVYSGSVSPQGSFEIQGVASGEYDVSVLQEMPPIALGHVKVRVDDRDADDVSIEVARMHPLKGALRFEDNEAGRSGLLVALLSPDSRDGNRQTLTRADGGFDFPLVPPGRYRIIVDSPSGSQRYYLKLVRFEDRETRGSIISLTGDESSIELVLSTRGARVAVNMKREDAAALVSAGRVVLIPDMESAEKRQYGTLVAVRDQNGAFSIGNIPPGTYRLFAFENVPDQAWTDAEFWKAIRSKGTELQISEGESKSADAPLLLKSEIAGLLIRLGME